MIAREGLLRRRKVFLQNESLKLEKYREELKEFAQNVLDNSIIELGDRADEGKELFHLMHFSDLRGGQDFKRCIDAGEFLSELSIKQGIDFICCEDCYEFRIIEEYPADYLVSQIGFDRCWEDVSRYFDCEMEWYKQFIKSDIVSVSDIELKDFSNLLDKDACMNALYRYGLKYKTGATYQTYFSEWNDQYMFQVIRNCVEISHLLGKERLAEKRKYLVK